MTFYHHTKLPLYLLAIAGLLSPELSAADVIRVEETEDQIVKVRTKVRHTTLLVLPDTENILDFVLGDAEYWHLTGAANLAYLKPISSGVSTNVALVCASGKIYSFLATEGKTPHLVVRIERAKPASPAGSATPHQPAFIPRSAIEGYQQAARQAAEAAQAAQNEAAERITHAQQQATAAIDRFRAGYPARLQWPYRLEKRAFGQPFRVQAMWHDGQFTYLRCQAEESPALYELKDDKPSLVAYDLTQDGLYIVRHVLGPGWLSVGKQKAKWRVAAAPNGAFQ